MSLPPGPRGWPLVGSLFEFLRDMPEFFLEQASQRSISGFTLGPHPAVLVNEPEEIQRILVTEAGNFVKSRGFQRTRRVLGDGLLTSEGAFHLRQRRLAQKAFTRARIQAYAPAMLRAAGGLSWTSGEVRDVLADMTSLTLRIAAETLFSADVTGRAADIGKALDTFLHHFPKMLIPGAEVLDWIPGHPLTRARRQIDSVLFSLIEERRRSADPGTDLLGLLMSAVDEEGDGGRMNDVQLRDELVTMLLAGHETTANALSFTLYLLAVNPAWQDKVREEALAQPLELDSLPLTRNVFAEGIRLYPPAWTTGRKAVGPFRLGPWTLPAGCTVFVSPLVTHRDARFFSDPLAFLPSRERPRQAYFPFGAGIRQCIGERFAWQEGVLILATLLKSWRFAYEANRPPRLQGSVTLRPRDGLGLRLRRCM